LKNEIEFIEINPQKRLRSIKNILFMKRMDESTTEFATSMSTLSEDDDSKSTAINLNFHRSNSISQHQRIKHHRFRTIHELKLAFNEFYLMLILLKNYQALNFTGFRKILKKHDKLFATNRGNEWR
jgi:xenotropic and polytropic retrovirus receptor 1